MAFIPEYIFILFLIILLDYVIGLTLEQINDKKLKKFYLVLSLLANISLLAFFKYFNFINLNLQSVFQVFGEHYKPYNLDIILPIGLSFHTFQSMSYIIEVYRGNQKAERHLGYFANYVLFFPQMVAGPIEKYSTLGKELKQKVAPLYDNYANGFRLILFGFFVKMAVADNIAPLVNSVYENPTAYNSASTWAAVFLFSIQIYADFYGYSTIAVGSAKLLGIELMDNFKTPYLAISITEFWKRWHISLTSWFRNYLYLPLGGNKVNAFKWIFNILIVFIISGIWHGASWTFAIWGLIHAVFYLLEKLFSKLFSFKAKEGFRFINLFLGIKTFLVVSFAWIFFRAETFDKAMLIFEHLFSHWNNEGMSVNYLTPLAFATALILSDVLIYYKRFDLWIKVKPVYMRWSFYTILLFCIVCLAGVESLPFIYFQF